MLCDVQRSRVLRVAICGLLSLALLMGLIWHVPHWLDAPGSSLPTHADAIVVLGGNSGVRVNRAVDMYSAGVSDNLVLSIGTQCSAKIADDSLGAFAVLRERRIAEKSVTLQTESCNTWVEARDTAKLMQARGWRYVVVVTDPPHLRRTDFSFKHALADTGLMYSLVATEPDWWSSAPWWRNDIARRFVQNELVKLPYYWMRAAMVGTVAALKSASQSFANVAYADALQMPSVATLTPRPIAESKP